jgi:3-oxoacyl-[acyl-carrier protein] reductase
MADEQALSGEIALVTGGDRGIGRAIVLALARTGADVGVNYHRREHEADRVRVEVEGYGRRCLAVGADVSDAVQVTQMVAAVQRGLGTVSILVNNAGVARPQPLDEIGETDWNRVLDTNLKSAFLVTQAVLPAMRARGRGRIVNISSAAAQVGGVVGPHYAASKAGMIGLTHAYASWLAREGITVNAIAPALVKTDMLAGLKVSPDRIPVGRFGRAEEVATAVLMLVQNGYITGQTLQVDGGLYMT